MRADGTVLQTPGYDAATQFFSARPQSTCPCRSRRPRPSSRCPLRASGALRPLPVHLAGWLRSGHRRPLHRAREARNPGPGPSLRVRGERSRLRQDAQVTSPTSSPRPARARRRLAAGRGRATQELAIDRAVGAGHGSARQRQGRARWRHPRSDAHERPAEVPRPGTKTRLTSHGTASCSPAATTCN